MKAMHPFTALLQWMLFNRGFTEIDEAFNFLSTKFEQNDPGYYFGMTDAENWLTGQTIPSENSVHMIADALRLPTNVREAFVTLAGLPGPEREKD